MVTIAGKSSSEQISFKMLKELIVTIGLLWASGAKGVGLTCMLTAKKNEGRYRGR